MNKCGFSMIEFLATITILGILTVIAIGSVKFFIDKGKAGTYDSWSSSYWTHNGGGYNDRVSRDSSIASACVKACANKFD